jgi:hypothetical protein
LASATVLGAFLTALMAACGPPLAVRHDVGVREPAEFPAAYYRRLAAQGRHIYRVDPSRSIVVVEVRRGGPFARYGHDHVVASREVQGSVAPDDGRADLWLPLDALVVDDPALRAAAGFDTQPSAEDIAGTRRNMIERVLETEGHPYAVVGLAVLGVGDGATRLQIDLTLRGVTRRFEGEATLHATADDLEVSGSLAFDQSAFGIVPMSVLGGAIVVQDRLHLTYRVRAVRTR